MAANPWKHGEQWSVLVTESSSLFRSRPKTLNPGWFGFCPRTKSQKHLKINSISLGHTCCHSVLLVSCVSSRILGWTKQIRSGGCSCRWTSSNPDTPPAWWTCLPTFTSKKPNFCLQLYVLYMKHLVQKTNHHQSPMIYDFWVVKWFVIQDGWSSPSSTGHPSRYLSAPTVNLPMPRQGNQQQSGEEAASNDGAEENPPISTIGGSQWAMVV